MMSLSNNMLPVKRLTGLREVSLLSKRMQGVIWCLNRRVALLARVDCSCSMVQEALMLRYSF